MSCCTPLAYQELSRGHTLTYTSTSWCTHSHTHARVCPTPSLFNVWYRAVPHEPPTRMLICRFLGSLCRSSVLPPYRGTSLSLSELTSRVTAGSECSLLWPLSRTATGRSRRAQEEKWTGHTTFCWGRSPGLCADQVSNLPTTAPATVSLALCGVLGLCCLSKQTTSPLWACTGDLRGGAGRAMEGSSRTNKLKAWELERIHPQLPPKVIIREGQVGTRAPPCFSTTVSQ